MGKRSSVADCLAGEIMSGAVEGGWRLPSQSELVRRYGCSRSTVVRALESLRSRGLVECRQGAGVFARRGGSDGISHLFVIFSYRVLSQYDPYIMAVNEIPDLAFRTTFVSSLNLGECQDVLCRRGNAVIWLRPGEKDLPFIDHIERLGLPQLLVNRHYGSYDAIWSGAEDGIRRGVAWLAEQSGKEMAFITPHPVVGKPYWAERMVAFYETCFAQGITLCDDLIIKADFSDLVGEIDDVAGRIFLRERPPRGIFVLNYKIAVPLVIGALKYGKQVGRDYFLLVFDEDPRLRGKAGVARLNQPYLLMSQAIGQWLKKTSGSAGMPRTPFRKVLECTLELPPV